MPAKTAGAGFISPTRVLQVRERQVGQQTQRRAWSPGAGSGKTGHLAIPYYNFLLPPSQTSVLLWSLDRYPQNAPGWPSQKGGFTAINHC